MEGLLPPASAAIAIASAVGRSGLALWLDRIGCCLFLQFILAFGCCYLFPSNKGKKAFRIQG